MRRLLKILVAASLTLVSSVAQVSKAFGEDTSPTLHSKSVTVDGEEGVFFPQVDADRVLDILGRTLPALKETVETQDKLIGFQSQAIATSSRALSLSILRTSQEHERAEELKSLVPNQSFFSSPLFYTVVGATAMGVAVWLATQVLPHSQVTN